MDQVSIGDSDPIGELAAELAADGLISAGSDGVVLLSGGADSSCLAAVAVAICGPQAVAALHVNYGLRADADEGERAARALCAMLRIDLHIERPTLGEGNLQARARAVRYEAAESLRAKLGAEWIAAGHTRTDLAETVLYRLAVSPGARALLGMPASAGRLRRPLLGIPRERTRALALRARLPFADDPSNLDLGFARNRIRAEVMPPLVEIGPAAERNIAETQAELREDGELIVALAQRTVEAAGSGSFSAGPAGPLRHEELAAMHPALRRAVFTALAERAAGRDGIRISRDRALELLRLAADPEGGVIELGRGLRAVAEAGTIRFLTGRPPPAPAPVLLRIPGRVRFGEWEITAELGAGRLEPGGPELASLDADRLGSEVEVRGWREGDRIRPLGLDGSKSLQDLFTDRRVPRSVRPHLPVLVVEGRVAWVAGVAIADEFRIIPGSSRSAVISARAVGGGPEPGPL